MKQYENIFIHSNCNATQGNNTKSCCCLYIGAAAVFIKSRSITAKVEWPKRFIIKITD